MWPARVATLHIDLITAWVQGRLGVGPGGHRRTLSAYLQNLVMVQNWFSDRPSFNGPAWSISSEWFAYLLAPLLFLALARVRRAGPLLAVAAAAYAVMLATFAAFALPNGNLEHMFYMRIGPEFLAGRRSAWPGPGVVWTGSAGAPAGGGRARGGVVDPGEP